MKERPAVSQITTTFTSSHSNDDHVNPFDSPRTYSTDDSITSLSKPARVVLQPSRHQRMASATVASPQRLSNHTDEILGVEQEQEHNEKNHDREHQRQQSVDRRPRSYDPEKATYSSPRTSLPTIYTNDALSITRSEASLGDLEGVQASNALRILLYLSGPCVLLSFTTMLWACISLLLTILYQPLRLCTPRLPFRKQLCHLLAPTLSLHLRCVYAPVFARPADDEGTYCGLGLLVVHLVAPLVSLGNAIAAWVVALYWGLARIVGDPSGVDKKDDGVEAVLGLTRWWQGLLMKGVNIR